MYPHLAIEILDNLSVAIRRVVLLRVPDEKSFQYVRNVAAFSCCTKDSNLFDLSSFATYLGYFLYIKHTKTKGNEKMFEMGGGGGFDLNGCRLIEIQLYFEGASSGVLLLNFGSIGSGYLGALGFKPPLDNPAMGLSSPSFSAPSITICSTNTLQVSRW